MGFNGCERSQEIVPLLFDPLRTREAFEEFNLRMLREREKTKFMPTAVGNAAVQGVSEVAFAWLVGLHKEIDPALRKYREWIEDSIARNERFGDYPAHAGSVRSEAYGMCVWMLENRNHEPSYRDALARLEEAWDTAWNDGCRPASTEQRLETIDDYLADCLQCAEYARGVRMYELVGGSLSIKIEKIKTAREFGYWLCKESAKEPPAGESVIAVAEPFLKENLESNWLGHGRAFKSAAWLKIVYWHSGAIESPLECILKAYDLMPHVERPAFV